MRRLANTREPDDSAVRSKIDRWASSLLQAGGRGADNGEFDPEFAPPLDAVDRLVQQFRLLLLTDLIGAPQKDSDGTRRTLRRRIAEIHRSLADLLANCSLAMGGVRAWPAEPRFSADPEAHIRAVTDVLFDGLGRIRESIALDLQATYDGDPACRSVTEAALCYPGVYALAIHRVAHELHKLGAPLLPRMMNEVVHRDTGIDIHPGARIGQSCCIDHGTGVVIGETTVIANRCRLYQGVTLGAKSIPRRTVNAERSPAKRHPTLQDDVIVYAGATILGGDTVVGAGSVIGGGVFLTESVPPGSVVTNPGPVRVGRRNPDRVVRASSSAR